MAELLENISLSRTLNLRYAKSNGRNRPLCRWGTRVLDPVLCEKQRRELPATQMGYFAW